MDAISAVRRTAHQLDSGNHDPTVESAYETKLPARDTLEECVDTFFAGRLDLPIAESLRTRVEWALRALYEGVPPPDGDDISSGLEAVVIADGSRPVFFVADDRLVLSGAGDGPFVDVVRAYAKPLESASMSIGRVETDDKLPPPGMDKWYEGTAFLIADQLVMTNRHVVERMVNEPQSLHGPFTLKARYWLNFGAQANKNTNRRFKIERVVYAGSQIIGRGGDLSRLDMALLKIGSAEIAGTAKPKPLPLSFEPVTAFQPIAVVGYPAAPLIHTGVGTPPVDHELEDVLRRLFDNRFGYKRCASGEIDAVAGFTQDTEHWTVQHDASTLSGNSGSPVLSLSDDRVCVCALHFSGMPRAANYAHVFPKLKEQLRDAGVVIA